ncbi:serpentine type 7TM GPCR receptor class ab chemoreceptor domain-containing protein [Ditylenchus destructor]|uniref:Serpentine type 7TM GPCR receptor class ab chemoreceptor domain-containing protein n=1 Tax=Ditylenchus destructor TaxID=166010 RepID=A0AAD4NDG9_9BILA|nr:serpentine type 7TM GPCR receptor class ab chemoreceptor domain-containing protein [Ditylenchus destructor]
MSLHYLLGQIFLHAELFLIPFGPFLNAYFIYSLVKHTVMHNNLRVLMIVFSIVLICMSFSRMPQLISSVNPQWCFLANLSIPYYIHSITIAYFQFTVIPLTIERIIATVRSKKYEKEIAPYFGVASCLVLIIVGAAISTYMSVQFKDEKEVAGVEVYPDPYFPEFMVAFASLLFLTTLSSFIALIIVFRYNRQRYLLTETTQVRPMQERYQYSENIRTSVQLMSILVILFVCNSIMALTTILYFNKATQLILPEHLYDFVVTLGNTLVPIAAIMFHSVLRRKSHKYLCNFRRHVTKHGENKVNISENAFAGVRFGNNGPKSLINGQDLIFSKDKERELYFEQLRKSWK